jgi:uncharacterized protein (TIGR00251 family)
MGRIRVHVQPGASRNEIQGFQDDVLRIKLMAPPLEGRANKSLISFLAGKLHVKKAEVSIVVGQSGRDKIVEVQGVSTDELRHRIQLD